MKKAKRAIMIAVVSMGFLTFNAAPAMASPTIGSMEQDWKEHNNKPGCCKTHDIVRAVRIVFGW